MKSDHSKTYAYNCVTRDSVSFVQMQKNIRERIAPYRTLRVIGRGSDRVESVHIDRNP